MGQGDEREEELGSRDEKNWRVRVEGEQKRKRYRRRINKRIELETMKKPEEAKLITGCVLWISK